MKKSVLDIEDVLLLKPHIINDERGYFFESYNNRTFSEVTGLNYEFVQDNQSFSKKGVLRGLHYQLPPYDQGKLIRVIEGEVFDVAVDIRKKSKTFLKWIGVQLSAENHNQLWIPSGFAHGYLVTSENACLSYKTTNYYSSAHERTIIWNDKTINIKWPNFENLIISEKDRQGLSFQNSEIF